MDIISVIQAGYKPHIIYKNTNLQYGEILKLQFAEVSNKTLYQPYLGLLTF
jgi:hypothetical protein